MLLDWLVRAAIGCLACHFSLELLEGLSDLIALSLLLTELLLEIQRHSVVSVLGGLQINTSLMYLSESV